MSRISKIECRFLQSFHGRVSYLISTRESGDFPLDDLKQNYPELVKSSQDFSDLQAKLSERKARFRILSRVLTINAPGNFKARSLDWIDMGKTTLERNLSMSPGLSNLLPYFSFLKYCTQSDMLQSLKKLLVMSCVIMSDLPENSSNQKNAEFPIFLSLIIEDLKYRFKPKKALEVNLTHSNSAASDDINSPWVSNLFFSLFENCRNLETRKNILHHLLSDWETYALYSEEDFLKLANQFARILISDHGVDHRGFLETILIYLSETKTNKNLKGTIGYQNS